MSSFLKDLAIKLYQDYQSGFSDLQIVFPNKRAGLFFRKNLAEVIQAPVWAPEVLSMEDFVKKFSGSLVADKLTLVFLLYDEYQKAFGKLESFDKFYSWGEILLKDFDDIDKYLINPEHLFSSIKTQKELEYQFDYLTDEQKEIIKSFWSSFGAKISSQQKGFLQLWDLLPKIYLSFKNRLKLQNIAYEGMLFREIAERAKGNLLPAPGKKIIFAGFNALSSAEELLIKHFISHHKANVFWDLDKAYLENPKHEAGGFLRKYYKSKTLGPTFPNPLPGFLDSDKTKNIEIIGVPLAVGQAKKLGEKIQNLIEQKEITDLTKTVVVLPEEHLLFPVLHSLPENVQDINVTMGFPLKESSLYAFLEGLILLQDHLSRNNSDNLQFHHKKLLAFLRHPLVQQYDSDLSQKLIKEIESKNIVNASLSLIDTKAPLYKAAFRKAKNGNEVIEYLVEILLIINASLDNEGGEESTDDREGKNDEIQKLEKEFVYQAYTLLNRLKEILKEQQAELQITTFLKIFRQMASSYRLPFSGEPLNGLQVMGALETRNLDFENVFILSMNEGAFPAKSSANSYIPFNLRKGFGLPTIDQQDSNYAYTFYRLLQRAKNVYLFYNTESGNNLNGEMSRFLFQLMYESPYIIKSSVLANSIKPSGFKPITVEKTEETIKQLNQYLLSDGTAPKRLTPSALNIYLDCRLKFYFRHVLGLKETETVKDSIDPALFGNILHLAMETIYGEAIRNRENKEVYEEDFQYLFSYIKPALNQAFAAYFSRDNAEEFTFEGADIIANEIIEKYARQILAYDKAYAPFQIIGLEADEKEGYYYDLPIGGNGRKVGLKGVIDRIDLKEGVVRVIDYKSGQDNKVVESVPSLFDRDNPKRNKAAMQTFFYGLLFNNKFPNGEYQIVPGIFNIKEMFNDNFDFRLNIKNPEGRGSQPINDFLPFLAEFKEGLQNLVAEIFDPTVPFNQTSDLKKCSYCPFNGICHRV